jgi:hypothetical protein
LLMYFHHKISYSQKSSHALNGYKTIFIKRLISIIPPSRYEDSE